MTFRNYIHISQKKGKKKDLRGMRFFFCQNKVSHSQHRLKKIILILKSEFSFNNGNILEIHDYFRTRQNYSFNDLSQLINAL